MAGAASVGRVAEQVRVDDPSQLHVYARRTRQAAKRLLDLREPHTPIDPAAGSLLAAVHQANEKAVRELGGYGSEAYLGLGGLAGVADGVATRLPEVDGTSAAQVRGLVSEAESALPPRPEEPVPDPRFVSPAVPR